MTPVATSKQRRDTLRAIDRAEARMLPPGWDADLGRQFDTTLTDTRGTAPLLIDVAEPDADEATPAEPPQRRPPRPAQRPDQVAAVAGICAGLALIWVASI